MTGTDRNEVNNIEESTCKNNLEESTGKNETNNKSGRKKVKKKVLVKKAKGEKTADPVKKDLLGNIKLFIQIQNENIFIQTNISQSQRG